MERVLGIAITYRETEKTSRAIKSLSDNGIDVALVFNGWTQEYNNWLDKIKSYTDYLFLNKDNLGFCKGNNQAMKLAMDKKYDYIFLLNNDAWVERDCIELLLKVMREDEKIGMLQPKVYKAWDRRILDTTGLVFRYGNRYSWEQGLGYVIDRGQNERDENQYDKLQNILGCCACATLYRVKMLREIGLFWEKLWSLGEDVELSWRAYKYGWKAKFVPEAIAYHWRGYSVGGGVNNDLKKLWNLLRYRNWALTLIKHGNSMQKLFASAMWYYYGCKSWVGKRIGRNDIGGYYIWLCSLALLHRRYMRSMERAYNRLFMECNIGADCNE